MTSVQAVKLQAASTEGSQRGAFWLISRLAALSVEAETKLWGGWSNTSKSWETPPIYGDLSIHASWFMGSSIGHCQGSPWPAFGSFQRTLSVVLGEFFPYISTINAFVKIVGTCTIILAPNTTQNLMKHTNAQKHVLNANFWTSLTFDLQTHPNFI